MIRCNVRCKRWNLPDNRWGGVFRTVRLRDGRTDASTTTTPKFIDQPKNATDNKAVEPQVGDQRGFVKPKSFHAPHRVNG